MFSSNQLLKISGLLDINKIKQALEFAIKFSGDYEGFTREENQTKCCYQITEDNRYCIGWETTSHPSEHWTRYDFDFDIDIIARIVKQYLEKFPIEEDIFDGGYAKGFVMGCVSDCENTETIKEDYRCIVYFKPYTCFYAK